MRMQKDYLNTEGGPVFIYNCVLFNSPLLHQSRSLTSLLLLSHTQPVK